MNDHNARSTLQINVANQFSYPPQKSPL